MTETVELVIGVDTHKHSHTAAIVDAVTGGVRGEVTAAATVAGYQQLLEAAPGGGRLWAVEGAGSYGAGLVRFLVGRGEVVVEVERPRRPARRNGAKSDSIDAVRAAREALGQPRPATPKQGGTRSALAARLAARRSAIDAAGDAERQLQALLVTAPQGLRDKLAGLGTRALVDRCSRLRTHPSHDAETAQLIAVCRRLAGRIVDLRAEAREHEQALLALVGGWRPDLLELAGVGPVVAATVLAAWSHKGRVHSEAAFAQIAGTAPLPASSGQTTRHRLSRFGDRQLNRALHTIVLTRLKLDPATIAYAQRRRAEGKTDREIKRCLKRYIARQLFRQLESPPRPRNP